MDEARPIKVTASGVVTAKPCWLYGMLIGTDGVNDPTITAYDNASAATGTEIVPTNTYDASALGLNGVMLPFRGLCANGLYVDITIGAGTCEVTAFVRNL